MNTILLIDGLVLIRYRQYRAAGCPAGLALRFARQDAAGQLNLIPPGWFLRAALAADTFIPRGTGVLR